MVDIATLEAAEAHSVARISVDSTTRGTGLGAVGGRDFDQTAAAPGELVAQERDQAAPPGVGNPTRCGVVQYPFAGRSGSAQAIGAIMGANNDAD